MLTMPDPTPELTEESDADVSSNDDDTVCTVCQAMVEWRYGTPDDAEDRICDACVWDELRAARVRIASLEKAAQDVIDSDGWARNGGMSAVDTKRLRVLAKALAAYDTAHAKGAGR